MVKLGVTYTELIR